MPRTPPHKRTVTSTTARPRYVKGLLTQEKARALIATQGRSAIPELLTLARKQKNKHLEQYLRELVTVANHLK